jgi:hypothetical protein
MPLHEYIILPIYYNKSLFSLGSWGQNKSLRERVPLVQGRGIPYKNILNRNKKLPRVDM